MKNKKKENRYKLPATRFELFFDVIKQKWRTIVLVGFIFTLFALPSVATMFFRDYYVALVNASLTEGQVLAQETAMGLSIIYAVFVISFLILSIGISGLSKVLLYLSYEEGYSFFEDFKIGVKQNIKGNVLATLIYAIILYLTLFINVSITKGFVKTLPLGICQGLIFPVLLIVFASNTIYDWKFKDLLRNSAIIYIRYFLFILLFSLLLVAVFLLTLIPGIILRYIIILVYLIVFEPFFILGFVIYMNHCFDEGINKNNYPNLYRKGLFKAKAELSKEENNK